MQRQQKVLLNFLVIVFLLFYGITSVTTADDLTITHAYSLYSGSTAVDFSPNGNYIATGDIDGDVGFWEVGDDEAIDFVDLGGDVQGIAFSPDGRYLAADGNDGNVIVWLLDVATRTTVRGTYIHDDADNINSIAYSPDGRYVAVGVDLVWAYLWDLNSGERFGWGKTDASEVYDVAFSPDGRYLATGNDNGDLTLWELSSWWADDVNSIDFKPGGNVRSVAFSPNGKYLAADSYDGRNTSVTIYDIINNMSVRQIDPDVYEVNALAFSPDGQYLVVGGTDPEIIIYRIGTAEITSVTAITEVATIQTSSEVYDLAWSPDGTLISDGRDVWNVIHQTPNPPDNTDTNQDSDVTVSLSPSSVQSPAIGEQLMLSLNITGGENVSGYQATVNFDTTALKYVQSDNGDYLPDGAFFIPPVVDGNSVTLAASSLAGESNGDGTLATITFEVVAVKDSTLTLSDVLLTNSAGQSSQPLVEATQITAMPLDAANIVFESQTIYDSGPLVGWSQGNSNGVIEVGERIELKVTLKNNGTDTAKNVKGLLTTQDKSVHIRDALVDYGNIGPGSFGPPLFPIVGLSERSFKIEVQDDASAHDVPLTLHVTADNAGPWIIPITLFIVNRLEIQLAVPDNFILEEAFGPRSTYFTLKVQHPILTNIPDTEVSYDSCEIIFHIPERTHAFILPIQTQGERNLNIAKRVVISVGKLVLSGVSEALKILDLVLFFTEVIKSTDSSKYDLRIVLPTLFEAGRGRPDTEIDYVVLLKNETGSLKSISVTIQQEYRVGESNDSFTVPRMVTRNFGVGWTTAPAAQPVTISDYPSFQLLSPEVQDYLLQHFLVFANFEEQHIPEETALLPNYPNPFNPETWIPYQLATPADVSIAIYAADGKLVRTLDLGPQPVGLYESRSRAAYWDGKNALGEPVASGVYFYTLTAGEFTATRKMLIRK